MYRKKCKSYFFHDILSTVFPRSTDIPYHFYKYGEHEYDPRKVPPMKNKKSVVESRRAQIINILNENPQMKVENLAELLDVSSITIRRDLQLLESQGLVKRLYGKVTIADSLQAVAPANAPSHLREMQAIGLYAAKNMISNGDTIFMNSGQTTRQVLDYIDAEKDVTVITNNLLAINTDVPSNVHIMITGGELLHAHNTLAGEFAIPSLETVIASKTFLGVDGISSQRGLTTGTIQTVVVARTMMKHCNGPVIVLADSRKIGARLNFHFGDLKDISYLVTDTKADPEEISRIQEAGVKVILVDPDAVFN